MTIWCPVLNITKINMLYPGKLFSQTFYVPLLLNPPKLGRSGGATSQEPDTICPSGFGTKMSKLDFCRATVDGNSVRRNDSCLLKGELT